MSAGELFTKNYLQDYYLKKLSYNSFIRSAERRGVLTAMDVERLKDEVKKKTRSCYGRLPKKTPLNVKITGETKRESYVIQNLIYHSRPNYPVTANLYLPKDGPEKKPAVLCTCGHSSNGKAYGLYQEFARHLARMGYISLIYDPPGQGERIEYNNIPAKRNIRHGTYVHNHLGNLMSLNGDNFAAWEAWDGIRGIDYLVSRPDVDPKRIGVTGNSGGGTQSSHINCLDDRLAFSAPSCFVTQFIYNLKNELPTDAEQVIPGWINQGLDMADFFVPHIPRPVILIGQKKDFFDYRGLNAVYEELKRLYTIAGKPENIQLHLGPGSHGFHPDGRTAMYKFFNSFSGVEASLIEPDEDVEDDSILHASPQGRILNLSPKTTWDFIAEKAQRICERRKQLSIFGRLPKLVQEALAIEVSEYKNSVPGHIRFDPVSFKNDGPFTGDINCVASYLISNEPPSHCFLQRHEWANPSADEKMMDSSVHLHVSHLSSKEDLKNTEVLNLLSKTSQVLYTLDVRGSGPLHINIAGDRGGDFLQYYGGDYMYANHGLLLSSPLSGRRVLDVLSSFQWLRSRGYKNISVSGRGIGSLYVQLAVALDPKIQSVTLIENLDSFESLTKNPRYQWPFSAMIPGVLRYFDLPQVRNYLSERLDLKIVSNLSSDQLHIK